MQFTRRSAIRGGAALLGAPFLNLPLLGAAQAQPTRGGHLKIASGDASTSESLDPRTYAATYPMLVGYMWGRPLFRVGDGMAIVPEVAEAYEASADAKTWVIKLRKGLPFHHGRDVTASDVIWSINRHRAPEAASGLRPILDQIDTMEATSPSEVTFKLLGGNADWVYVLTDFHLMIQPEDAPADKGIGLGPYMVENYQPGNRTLLKRNPNFWNSDAAWFDSIEFLGINDANARVGALQTGEVDIAMQLPARIASMMQMGGFEVHSGPATLYSELNVHSDTAPFDNNDLRLALKYAIDRQELMDKIFFGHGALGNDHPVPSFFRYHASDLPQRAYDPEKAKYHFQKSGFSGDLPAMGISSMNFYGNGLEVAELYQQHAKRAGIHLVIDRVPDNGYWANTWNKRSFYANGTHGRATEDQLFSSFNMTGALLNGTHFSNAQVDQLILAARSEMDEAKRRLMYADIQTILHEQGGAITPYFAANIVATSSKIKGFTMTPTGDGSFVDRVYAA